MKVLYYFRHMDSSEALKFDVERKLQGLENLIQSSTPVHVTFVVENNIHKVHIGLHARNHARIELEEESDDMHKSIDQLIDILKRTLAREKNKQVNHHGRDDRFAAAANADALTSPSEEELDISDFDLEEFETVTPEANAAR